MLVISSGQMASIGEAKLVEAVAAVITEEFPDALALSSTEFKEEIQRQVVKAVSYGLDTEQEAAAFVITAWIMGKNFDTDSKAVADVLNSESLPPSQKAQWLEEWVDETFAALEGE